MLAALREIVTPEKSLLCRAYDVVLLPLNIVVGMRKVVQLDAKSWTKEARTQELALYVLSCIASVVFIPLILAVLLLKSRNSEHRWRTQQYMVARKEAFLLEQGYDIKDITREESSFSLFVSRKVNPPFWVQFSWDGKLKFSALFQQRIGFA